MLLQARLLAYEGRLVEAQATLDQIRKAVADAVAQGRIDGTMDPSFEVLSTMLDLVIRGGDDHEWSGLLQKAETHAVDQELIEVIEMRGIAALRQGQRERAREIFHQALQAARRIPNVMEPRIQRHLQYLSSPHTHPLPEGAGAKA
jgi:hypothetical protein